MWKVEGAVFCLSRLTLYISGRRHDISPALAHRGFHSTAGAGVTVHISCFRFKYQTIAAPAAAIATMLHTSPA